MDYILKPFKATPENEYIDYLLCRLMEFRRAGSRLGQKFSLPLTLSVTRRVTENQLGCKLDDPARFGEICAHLQSKIENTMLGRRNLAKGWRCYHSFEEDRTQEHTLQVSRPAQSRKPKAEETIYPQHREDSEPTAPAALNGAGHLPDGRLSDAQYAEANARRVLLIQAAPLLKAGVPDYKVARMLGTSAAKLSRVLNLVPISGSRFLVSWKNCERLLALPVERLAPPAKKFKGSPFQHLLEVPEIVKQINALYAASLAASGPQAMNDRRTGSLARTLLMLGDFPSVPEHLRLKLQAGGQPKPLVDFIKKVWTPEMEAKFRGQKHYNQSTVVGRRDLTEQLVDGRIVPLIPGDDWVFDDMSSNLPFWFNVDPAMAETVRDAGLRQLIQRHGCALGRQGLYAWDWASGAWLGVELIGRLRDAYRASDILRFLRKLVMIYGKPRRIIFELAIWQSHCISGWKVREAGAVLEIKNGWQVPDMAVDEKAKITDGIRALGIEVIYTHTSRGKPIEGAFHILQRIIPMLHPGEAMNIGRHRGEFEWSANAHLRAGAGIRHPRDLQFVNIDRLADITFEAMRWEGLHDKARRCLQTADGETHKPLEILATQLNAHPLPKPTERDLAVFLPEKRDALIRRGFINCTLDGLLYQFGQPEMFAALGDGTRVDYAFDPDEPTLGAAIYDFKSKGFICWARHIPSGTAFSALDRSGEAGPQYIKAYKREHQTRFRAFDLKSLLPVIIAEHRNGAGRVGTITRNSAPLPDTGSESARPPQRVDNSRLEYRRRIATANQALVNLTD